MLTLIQKGGLCPLSLHPIMTEFSVFMDIAPENSCLEGISLKGLQNHMENKNEGNKKKILGDFNCTMDKMERDSRNKTLYVISIMPCRNSSWIVDWKIYGEGRTQIPLSSPALWHKIYDRQGLY